MNKWHMHKPESVLKNEMHKIFRDFEIKTDSLITARRLEENVSNSGFCCSGKSQSDNQRKQK